MWASYFKNLLELNSCHAKEKEREEGKEMNNILCICDFS